MSVRQNFAFFYDLWRFCPHWCSPGCALYIRRPAVQVFSGMPFQVQLIGKPDLDHYFANEIAA